LTPIPLVMTACRVGFIVFACGFAAHASGEKSAPLGLHFEANLGQTTPAVSFVGRGANDTLFLTAGGVTLRSAGSLLRMSFVGARTVAEGVGLNPSGMRAHYLIGAPESWHSNVPVYDQVKYRDIYPGVDVVYHSDALGRLEYDLALHPGAEIAQIRVRLEGAGPFEMDASGDLLARDSSGEWRHSSPDVYQVRNGIRRKVFARLLTGGAGEIAFDVQDYDRSLPLVIDPTLTFSTYLGGSGQDSASCVAVDTTGNAYVTGWTESLDFPESPGPRLGKSGGVDAYVAKISPSGHLLYVTYLGGSGDDRGYGIAVDTSGDAVVVGWTYSGDFPIVNAAQPRLGGGRDGFIAKLNPAGTALVFSTYWGGSGADSSNGVALDATGNIYVSGETASANFPVLNGFQNKSGGGDDAFIAKFSAFGTELFSTYLGGLADDRATAIAVDASGNAYITGSTYSPNFPVVNAFQPALGGGQDAFAAKLSSGGNALLYSTYIGGSGGTPGAPETGNGIAVDSAGSAYIAGTTSSSNFPTVNALQPSLSGSQDAFALKVSPTGSALVYSTYLGGSSFDFATGIAVDGNGEAYIAGYTASTDFPIANSLQSSNAGGYDAFMAQANPVGNMLEISTYLGGSGSDAAYGIALDTNGGVYLVGQTSSTNFPAASAIQAFETAVAASFVADMRVVSNQPPMPPSIHIDFPAQGNSVSGTVSLSGWAVDNTSFIGTAIGSVQVLVDGQPVGIATYGVNRPDVCAAYPGRPGCPNVGFAFEWNTAGLSSGTHTVTVSATDTDATPDTGAANVSVIITAVPPSVHVDLPAAGSVLSGSALVAGWAVDNASAVGTAIGSVQVLVDGRPVGIATYGVNRPDVCAAYPGRPGCPNVGFTYQWNTAGFTPGAHTVTVSATDTDATPDTGVANVSVTITAAPPSVHIDLPAAGPVLSGSVMVAGWAVDNTSAVGTAISSVQVLVDGQPVGNATYGVSRPDVCTAYPGRPGCPYVGFTYALDTSGLSPGSHSLTVSATDGGMPPESGNSTVTIQVIVPPDVHIDMPANGTTVSGIVTVAGWAVDNTSSVGTAISSVQLFVDGASLGNATYGVSRPDVCAAYPGRPGCPNVGYVYSWNAAALSPGSHTITVTATDSAQTQDKGSASITIFR
jgi:hypothetical protein